MKKTLLIFLGFIMLLLSGCDWRTYSRVLINNSYSEDIKVFFYKDDELINDLVIQGNIYKNKTQITKVNEGLLIPYGNIVLVEYLTNFGPAIPIDPFLKYNKIIVKDDKLNIITELEKKDFKIYRCGEQDFIYFIDFYPKH